MHFTSQIIAKDMGISIVSPFLSENVIQAAKSIAPEYKVRYEGDVKYGKWNCVRRLNQRYHVIVEGKSCNARWRWNFLCAYFENLNEAETLQ